MWNDLDRWLDRRRMLAACSRDQYIARARACDAWLRARGRRIEWATTAELREWMDSLPATPSSRSQARKALMVTFAYLVDRGRRRDNPAESIERTPSPDGQPRPCPSPTMLLDLACRHSRVLGTFTCLLLMVGLRFSEARLLPWSAVGRDALTVRGKGGRCDILPLHPTLAARLHTWRDQCPNPVYVVACGNRGPASESAVRQWWRDALAGTELAGVTPHQCRHRFGTDVHAAVGDLLVTQQALRHSSPATTRIYAEVAEGRVREAVGALDYGR